jgi:phenylalanyl-tRNA synthetase beta chain
MKISLSWLKDYVEENLPLPQLLAKLNMIGLMVEEWEEKDGDIILDVETYANRPDTLGHLGVAREIATALGLPLKEKSWSLTEVELKTSDVVDVQIWDEDLCPRYCGIVVKDIQVGPSPDWLKKRIEAMGLNPINNVVDVTNYVLFSTAHPIHAFDLAKISGKKIIIRNAKKGERIKTLDGRDVCLSPGMLVIADEEKPVALAGVIGGEESAVSESTRDVFIESAYFDPISVRMTRKALGTQTDASYRFERGADISFPPRAALMAASLLTQLGGKATKEVVDVYPKPRKARTVILRQQRIIDLLGAEVSEEFVRQVLRALGFSWETQQKGIWRVEVPPFRVDIEREADLIEEIARFYGYDKIPAVVPPLKVIEPTPNRRKEKIEKVRQLLFHYGFDEVLNFSFSDPQKEALFETGLKAIELRNPISSKNSLLRTTLMGGLLETALWNANRGMESIHVFEVGNIYFKQDETILEQLMLGLLTTGSLDSVHWQGKVQQSDFFHLKGACEALLGHLRYRLFSFEEEVHPYFEKGYSLAMAFKGQKVGSLGLVQKRILDFYSLRGPIFAAEMNLFSLFTKQPQPFEFVPVPKFPCIARDLSFIVEKSVSYQDIKKTIEKVAIPYLEEFFLSDCFRGPAIPEGKVSLTIHFIYRHLQKTLLAEEVDKFEKEIINRLSSDFNIQLREGGKIDK